MNARRGLREALSGSSSTDFFSAVVLKSTIDGSVHDGCGGARARLLPRPVDATPFRKYRHYGNVSGGAPGRAAGEGRASVDTGQTASKGRRGGFRSSVTRGFWILDPRRWIDRVRVKAAGSGRPEAYEPVLLDDELDDIAPFEHRTHA